MNVPTLRAAAWALREARRANRDLPKLGLLDTKVTAPPSLPPSAVTGVTAVLRRRDDTCLVRALVVQSWRAAHGDERDVIIGVTSPSAGFRAHAWVDGDPPCHDEGFHELTRRSPA